MRFLKGNFLGKRKHSPSRVKAWRWLNLSSHQPVHVKRVILLDVKSTMMKLMRKKHGRSAASSVKLALTALPEVGALIFSLSSLFLVFILLTTISNLFLLLMIYLLDHVSNSMRARTLTFPPSPSLFMVPGPLKFNHLWNEQTYPTHLTWTHTKAS